MLRNVCAHSFRVYNRTINTPSEVLDVDKGTLSLMHSSFYQILWMMEYLRLSNGAWVIFVDVLDNLIQNNWCYLSTDWKAQLRVYMQ